jgi:hypothetical protein
MSPHPTRYVDQFRADHIRWAFAMARANGCCVVLYSLHPESLTDNAAHEIVMPGLMPGIHVFVAIK